MTTPTEANHQKGISFPMAKKSLPQRGDSRKSIDEMSSTELRAYIAELMIKRDRLMTERMARQEQPVETPKPPKATKLPTKRMTKTVAAFDNMTDSEQVDSLRAMCRVGGCTWRTTILRTPSRSKA